MSLISYYPWGIREIPKVFHRLSIDGKYLKNGFQVGLFLINKGPTLGPACLPGMIFSPVGKGFFFFWEVLGGRRWNLEGEEVRLLMIFFQFIF